MASVHVGIGQNADLAVAQPLQVRVFAGLVWIHPHRHRNVVNDLRGEDAIVLHLPRVENLASQGKDGLALLVTALLGSAAGAVALHQEKLVSRDVRAFAVGELSGQNRHRGALLLFHLLRLALALFRLIDHKFGKLLSFVDVIVQPIFKLRTHEARHQSQRVAARELLLRLALKLRVKRLAGKNEARARKEVFG